MEAAVDILVISALIPDYWPVLAGLTMAAALVLIQCSAAKKCPPLPAASELSAITTDRRSLTSISRISWTEIGG
jgi:hypothetical protein